MGDIWNLFQEDHLPSNNFYKLMINCMKTWNYLQKIPGLPLNTEIIKQTYKTMMENDNPIMTATNLFGNIINIYPFEDGNGRICCLILAHVLMQRKCCLFPVILSSFDRRGRRHSTRAVRMFDRKPSVLYTMIVKSLIHCWDGFEQNARMALLGTKL